MGSPSPLRRFSRVVLREIAAFLCSSSVIWAWCAGVFALLGFGPGETVIIVVAACLMSLVSIVERAFSCVVNFVKSSGPTSEAVTGFLLAAAVAALWIGILGERRLVGSNIADILLAGFVFGIPSGLASNFSSRAVRNIVDNTI